MTATQNEVLYKFQKGVFIVINIVKNEQNKYLLIQESNKLFAESWYFPAGAIEVGEDIITASKREALEESGIVIEPEYLLKIEHNLIANDEQVFNLRFLIVAKPIGGTIKSHIDHHSIQAKWFSKEEINGLFLRSLEVIDIIEYYEQNSPNLLSLSSIYDAIKIN